MNQKSIQDLIQKILDSKKKVNQKIKTWDKEVAQTDSLPQERELNNKYQTELEKILDDWSMVQRDHLMQLLGKNNEKQMISFVTLVSNHTSWLKEVILERFAFFPKNIPSFVSIYQEVVNAGGASYELRKIFNEKIKEMIFRLSASATFSPPNTKNSEKSRCHLYESLSSGTYTGSFKNLQIIQGYEKKKNEI